MGSTGARATLAAEEFALVFPHDLHQDVMARTHADDASAPRFVRAAFAQDAQEKEKPNRCSICHETYVPDAKAAAGAVVPTLPHGLLKTTPTGHDSCFNCHWQDGGEKPFSNDCAGCHKLLPQPKAPALPAGKDADAQFVTRAGFRRVLVRGEVHELEALRGSSALSADEHWRMSELKKLKLMAKDRMEAIIRSTRSGVPA